MDNLQHIDDLLRQASQVPANALVNDSDWAVVEKRLKRRKNRIYAMWFFLALISVSSVGLLFHINNQANSDAPTLAETKKSLPTEDINKISPTSEVLKNSEQTSTETNSLTTSKEVVELAQPTLETTAQKSSSELVSKKVTSTNITADVVAPIEHTPSTPGESTISQTPSRPFAYTPKETIHLLPQRKLQSYIGDISLRTLQIIPPVKLEVNSVAASNMNANNPKQPLPTNHWEVGVSFTPGLSSKITSENSELSGLINRRYSETVGNSETTAFANTFGINTQYHMNKWFVASGLFLTQRREQLDYNYLITEAAVPTNQGNLIYIPGSPSAYESVVYSGSNSYHFLEIPMNIGYKTAISRNFEIRTQLGVSYMALLGREGKKGNFTTLELEDLKDLKFNQHNIAANVKTGLYLNKPRFVVGIEPLFGINLNTLRSAETSAIKTNPYGYGLNITSAIKLFKL